MQLRIKEKHSELSMYKGKITEEVFKQGVKKLTVAFSGLKQDFLKLLLELLKENEFSNERYLDAVQHVICTCKYPSPTIADFIQYDKFIIVYTPEQFSTFCYVKEIDNPFKTYLIVKGSSDIYIKIEDILKFNLNPKFSLEEIIEQITKITKAECYIRNASIPGKVLQHLGLPSSTQMSHIKQMYKSTDYVLNVENMASSHK